MSTDKPSPSEPLYLVLLRKLVLLLLVMVASAIGLVALLLQARLKIPILAFLLTDIAMGLAAGFSARWIIPNKARLLRIFSALLFISGGLALLGWFSGWAFGIDLIRAGQTRLNWWDFGQILLATGFALLALYAWRARSQSAPETQTPATEKLPQTRRKPQKRPPRTPRSQTAPPAAAQAVQLPSQPIAAQLAKPKRKRFNHSRPKLVLSSEEEHRCPYCLELIDPDDQRGVVECEICHTLHHADCWAITGTCQVPHFTA
jgi:uncharacterized Zn-finger protein